MRPRQEDEIALCHEPLLRLSEYFQRGTEHKKARSHLTMVRFPTFHRPEHEKARSHLTIRSRHLTW